MMTYKFDNTNAQRIIALEKEIFERHRELIGEHNNTFSKYHCEIILRKCWTIDGIDKALNAHPPFGVDYVFWIGYEVLKNGIPIVYDDEKSILARSYGVLKVSKKRWAKPKKMTVEFSYDLEDVKEDLKADFQTIISRSAEDSTMCD